MTDQLQSCVFEMTDMGKLIDALQFKNRPSAVIGGGGCRFSLRRFQRLIAPFVRFQVYLDSELHIRTDGGELKEAKQNKRAH